MSTLCSLERVIGTCQKLSVLSMLALSTAIRVYVLEGQHAQLSTLGFPALLVLELQECRLAGFSVSFFWPAALTSQRRRCRHRRKPKYLNVIVIINSQPAATRFTRPVSFLYHLLIAFQLCPLPPCIKFKLEDS